MIEIYLCDDMPEMLDHYAKLINGILKKNNKEARITTFSSGEALIFDLSEEPDKVDIIFLDILIKEMTGIETGQKLRELGSKAEIIFLTSTEEYVFDAFDVNPVDYILKDAKDDKKLEKVLLKAISSVEKKTREMFTFHKSSNIYKIPIADIYYFESMARNITLYYGEGEYTFYSTLGKIMEQLNEKDFARVHKSFVVNLKHIKSITKDDVHMMDGTVIPIGASYKKALKSRFSAYLSNSFVF